MLSFVLAFAGAGQVSQTQWDQEKANKDPMICTQGSIGSEVGTHLKSKKVCMTNPTVISLKASSARP